MGKNNCTPLSSPSPLIQNRFPATQRDNTKLPMKHTTCTDLKR